MNAVSDRQKFVYWEIYYWKISGWVSTKIHRPAYDNGNDLDMFIIEIKVRHVSEQLEAFNICGPETSTWHVKCLTSVPHFLYFLIFPDLFSTPNILHTFQFNVRWNLEM